jgi:hypothetical protein
MKRIISFFIFFGMLQSLGAQEKMASPHVSLKFSPAGLFLGNIGIHGEYNFGKNSLTAKLGIPLSTHHTFRYDDKDADFYLRATTFMAGYRHYLSRKHMKGLYFEPYFKYVHHTSEGNGSSVLDGENVRMNFTNDYNGVGIGAQLGVQFLIKNKFAIDFFFLGPEINSSRNNFKAVEVSSILNWNYQQSEDAERQIRDFIDKFPFIRNKVNVTVDQDNKTVRADFKGALPGYRIGVSFGVTF